MTERLKASCPKTQTNSRLARRAVSIVIDPWRAPIWGGLRPLGDVANTDTKLLICSLFQKSRVLAQDGVADGAVWSYPVSAKGILAILGVRIELLAVRVVGAM